jgi:hypothetical protein
MQISFILSPQFQKSEYFEILNQLEKEFSKKFPGIRKIVFEIKLHQQSVYKPASVISGMISEQLYKVKLNFERFYKGSRQISLPRPTDVYERIKTAVEKIASLSHSGK